MTTIADILKFKFTWRSYQQKFLDNYQTHIEDNHLHVVAPPGSGKTILGLEILRRVGKTTLILSPTLTIRNQWQSRMIEFFLSDTSFNDYTTDIKNPKQLTFSTYQSLHSLHKSFLKENIENGLLNYIKKHNIGTIVLDEAHHLKNEWWKCLFEIKNAKGITIVSLTATPPYDSDNSEVDKYFKLCGPIDDEIPVPELIKNGDLCPHQDYIHFSKPEEEQIKYIVTYRENIIAFMNTLIDDIEFRNILLKHPYYLNTKEVLEKIYGNPAFFSSLLIFLKACGVTIQKEKYQILGFEDENIVFPNLTYEWLQILLQKLLVEERELYVDYEEKLNVIEKQLRKIGVFEKQQVNFVGAEHLYKSLANSPSKLKSIVSVINAEYNFLRDNLRAVVLTDFIRQEFLDYTGDNPKELNKIGVVSIFQFLRTKGVNKNHLGVLTGSLVILHKDALDAFKRETNSNDFTIKPLEIDDAFFIISPSSQGKNTIVATITTLFQEGIIKTLIGTKALLGEGWDAPSINTLILASYVGSFVSSNQMRGRAIRTQNGNKNKTGNIWHLACIDPTDEKGGKDLEKLTRRFDAFSGVSINGDPYIENGISRLNIPSSFNPEIDLKDLNIRMIDIAIHRKELKERWFTAIAKGSVLLRELKMFYTNKVPYKEKKKMYYLDAAKYLFIEVIAGLSLFLPEFLIKNFSVFLQGGALKFFYLLMAGVFFGYGPRTYKAIKLYFLFGNMAKKTKKMGYAILYTLYNMNYFKTSFESIHLHVDEFSNGNYACYLSGVSEYEGNLFVDTLEEVIAPIDNPRYLLVNNNWFKRKMKTNSYYVVPALFGKRKNDAEKFYSYWREYVGSSKLIYTRTLEGRKQLIKARFSHIIYEFKEVSKKAITWK